MSSFLNSDSFEAGVGNVPSFAKIDNAAMVISAAVAPDTAKPNRMVGDVQETNLIRFGNTSLLADSYDRWTFLKKGVDGKTLHDKISQKLRADLDSESRQVIDQQEAAFDKAFRNWVITADFGVAEPNFSDYPQLQKHLKNVQTVESGITHVVFAGMTAGEKILFYLETEPLKPGQKSKQMTEEVLKRINEEAERFLNYQVSQREHNRT